MSLHPQSSIHPLHLLLILSASILNTMATAQVVSATTALHDEKIEEQPINKPQEEINTAEDQETPVAEPQPQETPAAIIAPEPEPEAKPETDPKPEPEPELETKELEVEVEAKAVIKEEVEEAKDSPVDQPAKVAPEPPCVEEDAKETKEPEGTQVEPEPKLAKPEPEPEAEPEPEEKDEKKEEVVAAE